MKRAEKALFAAVDASAGGRGTIHMSGKTWGLVQCGLAPYGGIGEPDTWGAIWFDGRLKLRIDNSVPEGEVEWKG